MIIKSQQILGRCLYLAKVARLLGEKELEMLVLGEEEEEGEGEGEAFSPPFSNRGNTVYTNTEPRRAETGEGEGEEVPPFPRSRIKGIQYVRIPGFVGQKQEKKKPPLPPSRIEGMRIPGFVGQKKDKEKKKPPLPLLESRKYSMYEYRAS